MYRFFSATSEQRKAAEASAAAAEESIADNVDYDEFKGTTIVVDLAEIDGSTEDFEGRQWLENRVNARQPIGWKIAWTIDRLKDSDNPVALMQFADESTALLLRTHRTRNWLPSVVNRALQSEVCRKVCAGFDLTERQKMEYTFNFQPAAVEELTEIARRKGVAERSLRNLAERFSFTLRKDLRTVRSNWARDELTQEQIRFAAEEAHFTYVLYDRLKSMPDPLVTETEGFEAVNHGVLELQPGWEDQGITRRHDGLYCTLCNKGPMTVPMVVERHMDSTKHKKLLQERLGVGEFAGMLEIPENWVTEGILVGDGFNGMQIGQFKCGLCDVTLVFSNIEAHVKSKKHLKHTSAPAEKEGGSAEVSAESTKLALQTHLWNLPDYIGVTTEPALVLQCSICQPPVNVDNVQSMLLHLGGDRHAKNCTKLGKPNVLYNKLKNRLEDMTSGKPVVRTNHKMPKRSSSSATAATAAAAAASKEASASSAAEAAAAAAAACELPPGWEAFIDPASSAAYYWHEDTQTVQWEHPGQNGKADAAPAAAAAAAAAAAPEETPEEVAPVAAAAAAATSSSPSQAAVGSTSPAASAPAPTNGAAPGAGAGAPAPAPAAEGGPLPPGWTSAVAADGRRYYADIEAQVAQWEPPAPYVHLDWRRGVDAEGRAFWSRSDAEAPSRSVSFFENGGTWERMADQNSKVFWICSATGERFFEVPP